MTDKLMLRSVLQGKNWEKPPFVPFVSALAARAANVGIQQMVVDPGLYSSALEGFHALLGVNILVANFDASMESEALGAQVHWPGEYHAPVVKCQEKTAGIGPDDFVKQTRTTVLIETVKRLSSAAGQEKAIACALLGPCAFIHMVKSVFEENGPLGTDTLIKQYGPYLTRLVRRLCEQKIDALFFREDILGEQFMQFLSKNQSAFKGLYTTLFNIVHAFNAFPLIITDRFPVLSLRDLNETLKPSGVVLLGHTMDQAVFDTLMDVTRDLKISIGLPLPVNDRYPEELSRAVKLLEALISKTGLRNIFYCSDGEISHDIDLAILLDLMETIRDDTG